MTTRKGIVWTFLWRREGFDASEFSIGTELFASACQYFMAVCLMAYIPYDAVFGSIKDIMQCYRQLHDSEA